VVWLVTSTFAIDHFDLFGIKQGTGFDIYKHFGLEIKSFSTRWHLTYCRHPIMWGFFSVFTVTPFMTLNHLVFTVVMISYIIAAVMLLEEPELHE